MIRRILFAAAFVPLLACFDEVEPGDSTIRGTYTLRTVNGAALPFTKSNVGGTVIEVLDGKISLYSGNTFAEERHVRTTVNGQATTQTIAETGAFQYGMGTTVTLNGNSGTNRAAKLDNGTTLTYADNGAEYVWKK